MGGVGVFLSGWEREREREREIWAERERERDRGRERERERERDCLLLGAEMVSSIVMYNFGVGPWGTLCFKYFRRATK